MIIEREHQLAALQNALVKCRSGAGGFLVATGPIGSGKTALLAGFAGTAAEQGFLCLTADGTRAERDLPLGAISQLCRNAPCDPEYLDQAALVADIGPTTWSGKPSWSGRPDGTTDHRIAQFMQALYTDLIKLSQVSPVLICIDDLHHVDAYSLLCLTFLVRRIRSSRILVIGADGNLITPAHPSLYAELLDQSGQERLRLTPLSMDGVSTLFDRHLSQAPSPQVVAAGHAASGGNPLLVLALAEDLEAAGPQEQLDDSGEVRTGPALRQAMRRCLKRFTPESQRILTAAAVLGQTMPVRSVPVELVGQLAEVDTAVINQTFAEFEAGGLLDHPVARTTALETLPPAEQANVHLLAAQLLREAGFSPLVVARQLLAAGRPVPGWAIPVLRTAAEHLLDHGDARTAIRLLQLAHNSSPDERERAALRSWLLRAEWRADSESAGHRLPDLVEAIEGDLLSVSDTLATINHLLCFGFAGQARRALSRLNLPEDHPCRADLRLVEAWTAHAYPGLAPVAERDPAEARPTSYPRTNLPDHLADVLEVVLSKGTSEQALTTAEQTLQRTRLDDGAIIPIVVAITVLIYTDHLETAALWCDRLIGQAAELQVPGWQSIFSSLSAGIALRQGRLAEAETRARAAIGPGANAGRQALSEAPVAVLLRGLVAMGRLDEAGELLEWPLSSSISDTVCRLSLLEARGHYYLAIDRPNAALDDFRTCGHLMEQWNLDLPALAAWRLDAAQAHLKLGQTGAAVALIEAQLNHPAAGPDRVRGRALRLQAAATANPQQRTTLLRDAVELLGTCGDRLELARALADLGQVYYALGDSHRARSTVRRAWQEAQACHAYALSRSLPDFSAPTPEVRPEAIEALSAAERRVAALASEGRTNHQIARKLFVTESTVEQHLTRIYRKLKVKRRADLPASLHPLENESA